MVTALVGVGHDAPTLPLGLDHSGNLRTAIVLHRDIAYLAECPFSCVRARTKTQEHESAQAQYDARSAAGHRGTQEHLERLKIPVMHAQRGRKRPRFSLACVHVDWDSQASRGPTA